MEKIKLNADALAFCQGMIFEDGALRPLPVPSLDQVPFSLRDGEVELPEIEFGLQKAGALAIAERFEVPARLAPSSDAGSAGSTATHPATETEARDALNASRAILTAYERAVAQQAHGKGMFTGPFFVRYAWRYADGLHSRASSPVLMLPAVLPPCLAVLGNEAVGDRRVLSFSPSSCRYFSLRSRVLGAGSPGPGTVALDIFITPPVSTYDSTPALPRGVARWSSASAFVGHFSESGDDYADRTAESIGLGTARAWLLPANANMASELLQSVDFYRVASIPVSSFGATVGFADVPIEVATDPSSVKACQRLEMAEDCASLLDSSLEVGSGLRIALGDRMLVASGQLHLPLPQALSTLAAASGAASAASLASTEVTVWAKREGQIRHVTKAFDGGPSTSWHGAFPRYIHYPCPGAFRMRIKQGARAWTLPLSPTADGRGACWWGGLGDTPAEPTSSTGLIALPSDNGASGPFDCGCVVAVSHEGNGCVRQTLCHCGESAPLALVAEPGQAGQAIALTAQGAWRLCKSAGRYAGCRLAAGEGALAGYGACRVPGALAYATAHGLALLSGASIKILPMPASAPDWPSMQLLGPAAAPQLEAADGDGQLGRRLGYDGRRLYARDSAGRCMAYSLASGAVGIPSSSALVVTRPFVCPVGKRLAAIALSGQASAANLALWGSHDGALWTLVASSASPVIRPVCGTPYRWYAVGISSPGHPAALHSIDCDWR